MKYRFLDHTADVMFEAYGKNLNEVFRNSALAVFDVQCDLKKVKRKIKKKIKLKNENAEDLLFDFLEELIYLKDARYMLFGRFDIGIKKKKVGSRTSLNVSKQDSPGDILRMDS